MPCRSLSTRERYVDKERRLIAVSAFMRIAEDRKAMSALGQSATSTAKSAEVREGPDADARLQVSTITI